MRARPFDVPRAVVGAVVGACLLTAAPRSVVGQTDTGFLDRSVTVDGVETLYQVYVPRDYTPDRAWPVILFLHGAGERGNDGILQSAVGLGRAIRMDVERWPAIVVMPQMVPELTWVDEARATGAMAALDATVAEFATDADRTYVTGMSMGGAGSWHLAARHPGRFAALVVVCGYVEGSARYPGPMAGVDAPFEALADAIGSTPTWVVHGDADAVVPVEQSRRAVEALRTAGGTVRYTELEGVGHNAWDPGYGDEGIVAWLFEQRRGG